MKRCIMTGKRVCVNGTIYRLTAYSATQAEITMETPDGRVLHRQAYDSQVKALVRWESLTRLVRKGQAA